ncbi:MAG: hypothetical protein IJW24_03020, partial [Clostridia bacterium]|nr:hypothetical protein [Clostridia bacterium]
MAKNNNKQKRGSLLWAGLLSFGLAALALVLGFYVGIMTINFGYGEFKNAGEYGFANNVGNLGNYAGFGNDYGNAYDSYVNYENFGAFPSNANTGAWGRASVVGSTIGAISAMNHGTIYLFVCAGLMIVLGSVGVTVAFKLLR